MIEELLAVETRVETSRVRSMNLAGLMKYVRAHRSGVVASVHSDGGPEAAYLEIAVTDGGNSSSTPRRRRAKR